MLRIASSIHVVFKFFAGFEGRVLRFKFTGTHLSLEPLKLSCTPSNCKRHGLDQAEVSHRLLTFPLQRVLEKGKLTIQHSALDQRSQATVRVENQLGRDMWLRVIDASRGDSAERILHLPAGQETRVALPPPQTLRRTTSGRSAALLPSDRNGTEQLRPKARRFAAVRIGKAEVRMFSCCSVLFILLDIKHPRWATTKGIIPAFA